MSNLLEVHCLYSQKVNQEFRVFNPLAELTDASSSTQISILDLVVVSLFGRNL